MPKTKGETFNRHVICLVHDDKSVNYYSRRRGWAKLNDLNLSTDFYLTEDAARALVKVRLLDDIQIGEVRIGEATIEIKL